MKNLFGDRLKISPSSKSQTSASSMTTTSTSRTLTTDNNDSLQRRCFTSHKKLRSKSSASKSAPSSSRTISSESKLNIKKRNQITKPSKSGLQSRLKLSSSNCSISSTTSRRRLTFNDDLSLQESEQENLSLTSISDSNDNNNESLETSSTIKKSSNKLVSLATPTPSITAPFSLRKQIALAVQLSIDEFFDNSLSESKSRSNSPKLSGHQLTTSSVLGGNKTNSSSDSSSDSSNFSTHHHQPEQEFIQDSSSVSVLSSSSPAIATTAKKFFRNNKGETELHLAAIRGDFGRLEHLLSRKTTRSTTSESPTIEYDINVPDFAGWTALHEACNRGHTQAVRVLVSHGANVNASASCGTTPLIDAAANGHPTIVKLLLKHGADPLQANKRGSTALDLAITDQIEELLKNHIEKKQQTSSPAAKDTKSKKNITIEEGNASLLNNIESSKIDLKDNKVTSLPEESISDRVIVCDLKVEENLNQSRDCEMSSASNIMTTTTSTVTTASSSLSSTSGTFSFTTSSTNSSSLSNNCIVSQSASITSPISINANPSLSSSSSIPNTLSSSNTNIVTTISLSIDSNKNQSCTSTNSIAPSALGNKKTGKQTNQPTKWPSIHGNGSKTPTKVESEQPDSNSEVSKPNEDSMFDDSNTINQNDSKRGFQSESKELIQSDINISGKPEENQTPSSCDSSGTKTVVGTTAVESTSTSSITLENTNVTSTKDQPSSTPHQLRGRKRRRSGGHDNGKKTKDSSKSKKSVHSDHCIDVMDSSTKDSDTASTKDANEDRPTIKDEEKTVDFSPHSTTTSNNNCNEQMRVPPIRIVLPPSSSGGAGNNGSAASSNPSGMIVINSIGLNSGNISGINGQSGTQSDNSGHHQYLNVGHHHQSGHQQKYPYVVTTTSDQQSDSNNLETNSVESINTVISSSGTTTTTTLATTTSTTSTHRITRSSQRVAQQKHHHDDNNDSVSTGTRKKKNRGAAAHQSSHTGLGHSTNANVANSTSNTSVTSSNYFNSTTLNSSNLSNNSNNANNNGENNNLDDALSGSNNGSNNNTTNGTSGNGNINLNLYQYIPERSSYRMFMSIRDHVRRRRQTMPIPTMNESKQPPGFSDYLLNRCDYLLRDSPKLPKHLAMAQPPPQLVKGSPLYKLFLEQEQERHQLRLRHQVEQEKLTLAVQQETLRLYNRADMCKKNQTMPLSVCTYLKDEELYNKLELETDHSNDNVIIAQIKTDNPSFLNDGPSALTGCGRIRYNGRVFLSWKSDDDDKWNKVKNEMLNRQRAEAESLAGIQRLRWEWKLAELEPEPGATSVTCHPSNIDDSFVPMVQIVKDFDLKPL